MNHFKASELKELIEANTKAMDTMLFPGWEKNPSRVRLVKKRRADIKQLQEKLSKEEDF